MKSELHDSFHVSNPLPLGKETICVNQLYSHFNLLKSYPPVHFACRCIGVLCHCNAEDCFSRPLNACFKSVRYLWWGYSCSVVNKHSNITALRTYWYQCMVWNPAGLPTASQSCQERILQCTEWLPWNCCLLICHGQKISCRYPHQSKVLSPFSGSLPHSSLPTATSSVWDSTAITVVVQASMELDFRVADSAPGQLCLNETMTSPFHQTIGSFP